MPPAVAMVAAPAQPNAVVAAGGEMASSPAVPGWIDGIARLR
jgi:hypothetical protein